MKKYAFIFLVFLSSETAAAYTRITTSSGQNPKWSSMPISYWIHEKGSPGISNGSDLLAVQASFRTWENIQTASVQFTYKGTTPVGTIGHDGLNIVTFTDTSAPLGSSTIAATFSFFKNENGQLLFDESDIAFNPTMDFSTSGESNKFDIQSVLSHEIGHLLGLDHSVLVSSVMVPFGATSQLDQRTLAYDDTAGVMEIYPNVAVAPAMGQVRGTIQANASPVFGAHVVAVDSGGTPLVSTLSQRDGSYILRFLPADIYRVFAEPLNGPVTQQNIGGGFYSNIRTNFGATYFGNVSTLAEATGIEVGPNSIVTADIQTFPPSPSGLKLTRPAFGIRVPRGRTLTLSSIGGVDITDGVALTGSSPGLQFGAFTFGGRVSSTAPTSVSMQLTVLPSTPVGPKNLTANRGTDASIVGGAFVITDSSPSGISVAPTAGPIEGGTLVTVRGANFRSGAQVYFAGLPGTDVRVLNLNTIQVTAPASTPGLVNVVVVNSDGTWGVASQSFSYVASVPLIYRVSPLEGPPTTVVTIEGDHFGLQKQNIQVTFGGVAGRVTYLTPSVIQTIVPYGATSGSVEVSVVGQKGTGPNFTVTKPAASDNVATRTYDFNEASPEFGGTSLSLSDLDDGGAVVSLPFTFSIFGDIYSAGERISISANGWLSLDGFAGPAYENSSLPADKVALPTGGTGPVPPSLIAPFWDDLVLLPGISSVSVRLAGTAPSRQFIVEWSNVTILDESGSDLHANLTFEAILFEGSNDIKFVYRDMSGPRADGSSATIGAQDLKRTRAILTSFNRPTVKNRSYVAYTYRDQSYATALSVIDLAPPAKPVVTDEGPLTPNKTQLAASWTSSDPESRIREYQYAIGTRPGGTDVWPFTSTTQNSVVVTGLNLQLGLTYYFAVKATSVAGVVSEVGVSAGVRFDPSYQPHVKIIPSAPQSDTEFTGIAFLAPTAMSVVLKAMDANGNLIAGAGIRNPTAITLVAGQQYAKLVSELFGLQSFDGWIEADASAAGLGIFEATGSSDTKRLDGNVVREPSTDFVLFHPGASAILVNPSTRIASVTLKEFGTGRIQSLAIPARGRAVTTLTGVAHVQSSEPLSAMERSIASEKSSINTGAPVSEAQSVLVFPHAVIGRGYASTLTVVNLGGVSQTLIVTFGTSSVSLQLDSNGVMQVSIGDLLHLPTDVMRTGAVRISVSSPFGSNAALIGVLDIENQSDAVTISARPAATDFMLPQVTNGNGLFTGLAFATGSVAARITIEVYSPSGGTPMSTTINLDTNQQLARMLTELLPASANQVGGYIRIRSDQAIWAWEIYGSSSVMASGPPL